jgi:hypothetical protein
MVSVWQIILGDTKAGLIRIASPPSLSRSIVLKEALDRTDFALRDFWICQVNKPSQDYHSAPMVLSVSLVVALWFLASSQALISMGLAKLVAIPSAHSSGEAVVLGLASPLVGSMPQARL